MDKDYKKNILTTTSQLPPPRGVFFSGYFLPIKSVGFGYESHFLSLSTANVSLASAILQYSGSFSIPINL